MEILIFELKVIWKSFKRCETKHKGGANYISILNLFDKKILRVKANEGLNENCGKSILSDFGRNKVKCTRIHGTDF